MSNIALREEVHTEDELNPFALDSSFSTSSGSVSHQLLQPEVTTAPAATTTNDANEHNQPNINTVATVTRSGSGINRPLPLLPKTLPPESTSSSNAVSCYTPRTIFLFGLMGEGKSSVGNLLLKTKLQNRKPFGVFHGQSGGTTQLQIEIGRSVSGEMLKVVDLPGANNTMKKQTSPGTNRNNDLDIDLQQQQQPTEPVSETTFWSELSEAFKRVKEDGFDMAALVLRCSSKMSEESFTFWDLFFTDNFGPSVWAKTAIVLTFADDIFGSRAITYEERERISKEQIQIACQNEHFRKLLNKVNGRCVFACASPRAPERDHAMSAMAILNELKLTYANNHGFPYTENDFRTAQAKLWSRRNSLVEAQRRLITESEARRKSYEKAIQTLNDLRLRELDYSAALTQYVSSSASPPTQDARPQTNSKKLLSEIKPATTMTTPFSYAAPLAANSSNVSNSARSPTTAMGDVLRPQPPPRRIPPKPLPTTTASPNGYPIHHRMLTAEINDNRALAVSPSEPSALTDHTPPSSIYCRSQSEIISHYHAPLPPIPVASSPNIDAKKPKKKSKGFFSKVFTTTSKQSEQR